MSSLTKKYVLWKGFYHDFSTKKASASGAWPQTKGLCPLDPHRGRCPLDHQGSFAPPNDLPWRRPWLHNLGEVLTRVWYRFSLMGGAHHTVIEVMGMCRICYCGGGGADLKPSGSTRATRAECFNGVGSRCPLLRALVSYKATPRRGSRERNARKLLGFQGF